MILANKNYGVVSLVSEDRTKIKIKLPRGGFAEAQNEGFEVGDVVAFTLNPIGTRVLKVMLKYVADLMVEIGRNSTLQSALQDEEASDEHNSERNGIVEDSPDLRPSAEECPDLYGRKRGEDDGIGTDYPGPEVRTYPTPWFEG